MFVGSCFSILFSFVEILLQKLCRSFYASQRSFARGISGDYNTTLYCMYI